METVGSSRVMSHEEESVFGLETFELWIKKEVVAEVVGHHKVIVLVAQRGRVRRLGVLFGRRGKV